MMCARPLPANDIASTSAADAVPRFVSTSYGGFKSVCNML
jgi:hypothetical protein